MALKLKEVYRNCSQREEEDDHSTIVASMMVQALVRAADGNKSEELIPL